MKCINYHRLATCSFHLPDFLTRILANFLSRISRFLTVQDNSRSYQGFQEVTGICGKIQDLGKSFKILYTGDQVRKTVFPSQKVFKSKKEPFEKNPNSTGEKFHLKIQETVFIDRKKQKKSRSAEKPEMGILWSLYIAILKSF